MDHPAEELGGPPTIQDMARLIVEANWQKWDYDAYVWARQPETYEEVMAQIDQEDREGGASDYLQEIGRLVVTALEADAPPPKPDQNLVALTPEGTAYTPMKDLWAIYKASYKARKRT